MRSESRLIENGISTMDLGFLVKNSEVDGLKTENKLKKNKKNNKRDLLEVSVHWAYDPRATEGFQGHFLALGRMTYSHLPNRIFI